VKQTIQIREPEKIDLTKKYFTNIVVRERIAPEVKAEGASDMMKEILNKAKNK